MGASFCVIFQADVPPHGTIGSDNGAIVKCQRQLDKLARAAGLAALGDFESYDPEDAADLLDDDAAAAGLPPVKWFDPAAGLAAVRGLMAYLNAHPDAVRRQADVQSDLAAIEAELADAERAGVQFRFAVVP